MDVNIVRNGKTLQQNKTNLSGYGVTHFFSFNTGPVVAGATIDFAVSYNDVVGLAVTVSDAVPNFAAVEFVHTDGDSNVLHKVTDDLNTAVTGTDKPTFVTDFKGAGDVTITALAGGVRDATTKDDFTSTRDGNNPTYLTTFFGSPASGTGDGHTAGAYLLRTRHLRHADEGGHVYAHAQGHQQRRHGHERPEADGQS